MKNNFIVFFLGLFFSIKITGQNVLQFGLDISVIQCFTHYNLSSNFSNEYEEAFKDGEYLFPNYLFGIKIGYKLSEKHSFDIGLNFIHKNYGIEYSNKIVDQEIQFDYWGSNYNFELPINYNYTFFHNKTPNFFISGILGSSIFFSRNHHSFLYSNEDDFIVEQIRPVGDNDYSYKLNYSIKTGLKITSYNSNIGFYEFGVMYSYDFKPIANLDLKITNSDYNLNANVDFRISYLSLFLRFYFVNYSIFNGRLYKI
jgi:hypothetical protein